uniref:Uncharacterized protein n=1 Tax=uncultured Desulfobacterium sp. TaxID=201089 RepID=E1YF65_9BACT|nr:hypothetical protein N47_J01900 [uncultured Desulfobacterium sp.]
MVANWNLQKNYAEYIYFHDYVRAFLFPQKTGESVKIEDQNIVCFFKHRLSYGSICLEKLNGDKMSSLLAGIYLYHFPNNIWVLVFETSNTNDDNPDQNKDINAPLISTGGELLLFNNMFRRVYPAYFEKDNPFEQMKGNDFPKSVSIISDSFEFSETYSLDDVFLDTMTPVTNDNLKNRLYPVYKSPVTELLNSFWGEDNGTQIFYPILDDRMLVHSYVAFKDDTTEMVNRDQDDIYFSHFMYVDNPGNNYSYDKQFICDLMQKHEYTRWKHYRTRMGFTRYSSAFMYFGNKGFCYRPFVSMYFQMFLLTTYYRASLIRFSNEIAEIAKDFPEKLKRNIPDELPYRLRDLHTRFMKFMNVHWFTEITNQDQGIEIYQKMKDAFELEPMYEQVKDEIGRADELVELIHQQKIERFQDVATKIGLRFALLAVIIGYFGMNFTEVKFLNCYVWNNFYVFGAVTTVIVILLCVCFKIYKNECRKE